MKVLRNNNDRFIIRDPSKKFTGKTLVVRPLKDKYEYASPEEARRINRSLNRNHRRK